MSGSVTLSPRSSVSPRGTDRSIRVWHPSLESRGGPPGAPEPRPERPEVLRLQNNSHSGRKIWHRRNRVPLDAFAPARSVSGSRSTAGEAELLYLALYRDKVAQQHAEIEQLAQQQSEESTARRSERISRKKPTTIGHVSLPSQASGGGIMGHSTMSNMTSGILGAAGQSTMSNVPPGSIPGASISDPVPAADGMEQADAEGASESPAAGDATGGASSANIGRGVLSQLPGGGTVNSSGIAVAAAGAATTVADQSGTGGGGARRIPRSSANSEASAHNACVLAKAAYGGVVTEHLQSRQLGHLYDQWREERRAQLGEEDHAATRHERNGGRNRAARAAMALSRQSGASCTSSCANSSSGSLIRPPTPVPEATSSCQSSSRWGPTQQEKEEAAAFEADVIEAVRAGTMAQKMQEQGAPLEEISKIWQQSYRALNQLLGPTDPETLTAASRASACLEAEGKHSEARSIYRQIVEGRRRFSAVGKQEDPTLSAGLRAFIAKAEDIKSNGSAGDLDFTRSERLVTVLTNQKVCCVSFAEKASDWGSRPQPAFIEKFKPLQLMKLHKGPWRPLND